MTGLPKLITFFTLVLILCEASVVPEPDCHECTELFKNCGQDDNNEGNSVCAFAKKYCMDECKKESEDENEDRPIADRSRANLLNFYPL